MADYEFIIPGNPVGKQRPRVFIPKGSNIPIATTPSKTRNYEALVKMCATEAKVKLMAYCRIYIEVYLPMRCKKFKTKPDEWLEPRQRPDLDNILKSIKDALQGIAFKNDRDVLEIHGLFVFTKEDQAYVKVQMIQTDWEGFTLLEDEDNLEGD